MITANLSAFKKTKPHEFAVRFLFGGACTAIAGWIAHRFGPELGGLFLAFPAIFPASASLIESHEREKKRKAGMDGTLRGREAASLDAAGASAGAIALGVFALIVWRALPGHSAILTIALATAAWALVAGALWLLRKSRALHMNRHSQHRHTDPFRGSSTQRSAAIIARSARKKNHQPR